MNSILDISVAIVLLIVLIVFIFYTRQTKTFKSFAVSNNSIGLFLIFLSFSATFIGPGFSLALVNQGFDSGYFYLMIAGFYGIAKIIEGLFLAPRIRHKFSSALSIGDIIAGKESHNNKVLHLIVGVISFGLVVGFSTVLSKAGGEVINNLFGFSKLTSISLMTGIVVLYSFFGGIKATILTDAFQFILFTVLILILLITLFTSSINMELLSTNIGSQTLNAFKAVNKSQIIGLISTWLLGEMLIPPTINRILATKSSIISRKGLIYSGIFMIIWLIIMLSIGVIIKTIMPDAESSEQLLLIIAKQKLKFGLFGAFAVAIVGIIMSSQDSLINSASVIFTNDILGVFVSFTDKSKLYLARTATVIVGGLSILFALSLPSILSGLLLVYSLWAPSILIPLFASIFLKRSSSLGAILSIVFGISSSLIWQNLPINNLVPSIFVGMVISLLVYFITFQLTIKNKHEEPNSY